MLGDSEEGLTATHKAQDDHPRQLMNMHSAQWDTTERHKAGAGEITE